MHSKPTSVAFVPARSGSKRVPHKNIRRLAGHPLMAYTVAAARAAGVFDAVVVATDDPVYAEAGVHYGAESPFLRPAEISTSVSPDIEWVRFMIDRLEDGGRSFEIFSILRPTNPFRRATTITSAFQKLVGTPGADSLRAISPVTEHPGKMWVVRGGFMAPLMPLTPEDRPWHSQQLPALPAVYKQNASLEIAWTHVAKNDPPSIAGNVLIPLISEAYDGFDINSIEDMEEAEALVAEGKARLPEINVAPFGGRLPFDGA